MPTQCSNMRAMTPNPCSLALAPTNQLHPVAAPTHTQQHDGQQVLDAWHCMMSASWLKELLFMEADSHRGKEVIEGTGQEDVLHRVLYPQVHANGIKKKKKKDFEHIIKHQQNVFMCSRGVEILSFCITPSILRSHLESNGVSTPCLQSLLNPNDKQDVILAYSLLKEIYLVASPSGCKLQPCLYSCVACPEFLRTLRVTPHVTPCLY